MKAKITTENLDGLGFSYRVEIDDWNSFGVAATEPKAIVLAQLDIKKHFNAGRDEQ